MKKKALHYHCYGVNLEGMFRSFLWGGLVLKGLGGGTEDDVNAISGYTNVRHYRRG